MNHVRHPFAVTAKFILKTVAGLCLFISVGYAVVAGKPSQVAELANGACLAEARGVEAEAIMDSQNIRVTGANLPEKEVLASAIRTLSVRSGGSLDGMFRNLQIQVKNSVVPDRAVAANVTIGGQATANTVELVRSSLTNGGGAAEATVIHELGHVIGRRGTARGRRLQDAYTSVPQCNLTTYCTHTVNNQGGAGAAHGHRREEFAEVVSAYIFMADQLRQQCPQSYEFIKAEVFGGTDAATSGTACTPRPFSRSYTATDGRNVPISGGGIAPGGTQALVQLGQQLIEIQNLNRAEEERRQAAQQAEAEEALRSQQPTYPSSGGGTNATENRPAFMEGQ